MKRLVLISLLLALLVTTPVVASDLDDATFRGKVTITNADTAATNVCVPFTLSTANLIADGYIGAGCTNTAMQINGADVAYMPAPGSTDDWIIFVASAPEGEKTAYLYTGGGDMSAKLCYFPDDGGMVTLDSATLELGNNFIIEQQIFFDATDGADDNLFRKDGAILGTRSDDGEITVTICGTSVGESGANANIDLSGDGTDYQRVAQRLNSFPTTWIDSCAVYLQKFGSPTGTGYMRVRTVSGDSILGTLGTIDVSTISSVSPTEYTFDTTPVANTSSQDIRVSFEYDGGDTSNYLEIRYDTLGGSTGECSRYQGSWTDMGGSNDLVMTLVYDQVSLVATGISTGDIKVEVIADGTDWSIEVDDVEEDTCALNGISVPDNANDWYFFENQVATYVEYHKITVSGTLQQHIIWENSETVFSDQSAHGHTADPTFRTISSDADVSAELVEFVPINEAQASGTGTFGSSLNVTAPDEIGGLYDEGDYSGIPGAEAINTILEDADQPLDLFWYPTIFGGAIVLGLLAYGLTRQMFVMGISMTVALALVSYNTNDGINITGGVIPFWTVLAAAILTITAFVWQNREAIT